VKVFAPWKLSSDAQRRFGNLEGKLQEDLLMARIRDAENTQCVAELTQKISNLEYKNQEMMTEGDLTSSMSESDRVRELQDKVACLRAQVTRLALMNSKLTQSLSMHNLAAGFGSSDEDSVSTPRQSPSTSPSRSSLNLDLGDLNAATGLGGLSAASVLTSALAASTSSLARSVSNS